MFIQKVEVKAKLIICIINDEEITVEDVEKAHLMSEMAINSIGEAGVAGEKLRLLIRCHI